ncbi:MAG: peptide-methionine (S)-S-oxide reductase [Bacteroidetes bacterium]|nr:MAG: peptide-methionine (S)-S-oxide reductase [Bacteroidota bacterium]
MEYPSIVFGGGCFWCIEAVFAEIHGVIRLEPGYAGGHTVNPTYQEVCSGVSGHAEVIRVYFDSEIINLVDLYEVFFATHDPTSMNRQGNDIGTQYRSAVFYNSILQKEQAKAAIKAVDTSGAYPSKVVTTLEALEVFYPAEDGHIDYFNRNPETAYCSAVISPKLHKFRKAFRKLLKSK